MKFIIGIGNPGRKYLFTRHNVGFWAVTVLATRLKSDSWALPDWKKDSSLKAEIVGGTGFFLVKPQTFVNNVGETISALIREYRPLSQDMLLVCDDVNLEFGKLRLRASGSAGGHHGLESAISAIGSEDFSRLRVGVGNEQMPEDVTGYVLEKFSSEELKTMEKILEKVGFICTDWIQNGFSSAVNRLSRLQIST